jgi:hypothetical protein
MSEEEDRTESGTDPAPEPAPQAAPEAPPQPASAAPATQPVGAGAMIGGIFLILFGLCFFLAGGSCTVIMLVVMVGDPRSSMDGLGVLLPAMAIGAVGLLAIYGGVRLCSGKRRKG